MLPLTRFRFDFMTEPPHRGAGTPESPAVELLTFTCPRIVEMKAGNRVGPFMERRLGADEEVHSFQILHTPLDRVLSLCDQLRAAAATRTGALQRMIEARQPTGFDRRYAPQAGQGRAAALRWHCELAG